MKSSQLKVKCAQIKDVPQALKCAQIKDVPQALKCAQIKDVPQAFQFSFCFFFCFFFCLLPFAFWSNPWKGQDPLNSKSYKNHPGTKEIFPIRLPISIFPP